MTDRNKALHLSPATLAKYSISVPRYTSYPTVPEWTSSVSAADMKKHYLESPADGLPLSIYVHLPFCMRLCLFCGCNMIITRNKSRSGIYLDYLEKEIDAVAKTALGKRPVAQMHWGGGTPTYLTIDEISRLNDMIRSRFRFEKNAEIGIEVDPRETSPDKVRHLAKVGFNRLSMGVQDFDPDVQKAVQRFQPEEMTRATYDAARGAGLTGLNIDLMYGLPHQTIAKFEKTLESLVRMRPDRVALFHYAHLPQMIKHQKAIHEDELPPSDEKYGIFCLAVDRLTEAGYDFIGLDHFALPDDDLAKARNDGTLNRNFNGYTTCRNTDLLGFGVTAISNIGSLYCQNKKEINEYQASAEKDGFAPFRGIHMTMDDFLRRDVIYRLMCQGTLVKKDVEKQYGIDFATYFKDEMADVQKEVAEGLAIDTPERIDLTPLGVMFMRNVAKHFDIYLRRKPAKGERFSKSV